MAAVRISHFVYVLDSVIEERPVMQSEEDFPFMSASPLLKRSKKKSKRRKDAIAKDPSLLNERTQNEGSYAGRTSF